MKNHIEETIVAIIGAGVSGLALATFLQKSGVACVILERRNRAYIEARQRAGVIAVLVGVSAKVATQPAIKLTPNSAPNCPPYLTSSIFSGRAEISCSMIAVNCRSLIK